MKSLLWGNNRVRIIGVLGSMWIATLLLLGLAGAQQAAQQAPQQPPNVVLVTGEDHYRSEITMPFLAELLGRNMRVRGGPSGQRGAAPAGGERAKPAPGQPQRPAGAAASTPPPFGVVLYAVNRETGQPDPKYRQNIAGLEALQKADLAMFFIGNRVLPDDQLNSILDYVDSGKPIVGLRTSLHAFQYPAKDKNAKYNTSFGQDVFGQKFIADSGSKSTTDAWPVPEKANHPILQGIYASEKSPIHCSSSLYVVAPLPADCEVLILGKSAGSGKAGKPSVQPVVWTRTYKGARLFFTTLGHPKDFEDDSVRRLLVNGVMWAAGLEVPVGGANVEARTGEWGWQAPDINP